MLAYQRLKIFFKKKGITQLELADTIGVSRQYVNGIMTGRDEMGLSFILKFHDKYPDLNLDWLILGRGNEIYNENSNDIDSLVKELQILKNEVEELKKK